MTDSVAAPRPGETREQWDRRRRVRMATPADLDPLGDCIVIAKHRVYPDANTRGPVRRGPRRVVEYDVLARKEGLNVVAYRGPDGSMDYVNTSSTPTTTTLSYEEIAPKIPDPAAKSGDRTISRTVIEPHRDVVIDDDGTEREVVRCTPRGY